MTAREIQQAATRQGLRLEPRGDMLAVMPKGKCPPDLLAAMRQHKAELLCWLEGQAAGLRPGEIPWLYVARQILDGEFDRCDRSTRETVTIGLRSIAHPACRRALERLQAGSAKA